MGVPWVLTDDVAAYTDRVWPSLAARPVDHTIELTALESHRLGLRSLDPSTTYGWYDNDNDDDGSVTGMVSVTPPGDVLLAAAPAGTVAELVGTLRAGGINVTAVRGNDDTVGRFAAAWVAGTGWHAVTRVRQRMYRLADLRPPDPAPPGHGRRAEPGESGLATRWIAAFQAEAGGRRSVPESFVRTRIDRRMLWLWTDEGGDPVALASHNPPAAGVARVGPVYTPPDRRRRGYGAAVTAAATQGAIDLGADEVVLFTDLANLTSNAIYQEIGYRPVSDHSIIAFVAP